MPSINVPVLAIKEANEHLQALFLENQKQDTRIQELSAALKQCQIENGRLSDYVKNVNDRVLQMGQEHIENLNALRESLNAEHQRRMLEMQESHERIVSDREAKMQAEVDDLRTSLKTEENIRIKELKDQWINAEDERISNLVETHQKQMFEQENKLKNEAKNRITDLQVKLKGEEKKKVSQLQNTIDAERTNVRDLELRVEKLTEHAVKNTQRREEHTALLNNMLKSTMENMAVCLNITEDGEFVGVQRLQGEGRDSSHGDSAYSSENVSLDTADELSGGLNGKSPGGLLDGVRLSQNS